jgi:catechol 2,3-dioxygenase-like lactoylglutathione lyase family enzyme
VILDFWNVDFGLLSFQNPHSKIQKRTVQIDHVNIVVSDLAAMTSFYRDVLGLKVTKEATISGEWIGRTVGLGEVHADVVYLDFPAGPRIELIRYNRPSMPRPADVDKPNSPGLRHMAFRVDDIDATATRLRAAGVRFFSDVQTVPDAQVTYAGGVRKRLIYFQDPEGNLLELCEYRT